MNCEKCKNKKATLFYADDDGVKHALCASCGAIQGRLTNFSAAADNCDSVYIPEPTLLTLQPGIPLYLTGTPSDEQGFCKGCGTRLSELKSGDGLACPECYSAFSDAIFPSPRLSCDNIQIKMPMARRERLYKRRAIDEARAELKTAIASENFELAANLRDKIKGLEGNAR